MPSTQLRRTLPEPLPRDEAGWFHPIDPPYPYQRIGLMLGMFGYEDAAEPFLRDTVSLDPDLFFPNYALGQYAMRRGDWEEAVRYLERALENIPKDKITDYRGQERKISINFFTARAKLNESRGNLDAAARDRQRARALSGNGRTP